MLVHRDVLLIAASYFCMNYVFYMFAQWLFTYLVEERAVLAAGKRVAVRGPVRHGRRARGNRRAHV